MYNRTPITLFEENEINISTLYSLYAQKIKDKSAFWNRLSQEEVGHAAQIGNKKDLNDAILENKFSQSIIKYVMDFVLESIEIAQKNEINHHEALKTALRIERSMLEEKCFDIFMPKNETVKEVFARLNKDTKKHIEILMKEMRKNKFQF
jgi:hypothetical protein